MTSKDLRKADKVRKKMKEQANKKAAEHMDEE